jgi:hypothetical protein
MNKWDLKNRSITLAVALISLAFVGSSYAAGSRLTALPALQLPGDIVTVTRPGPSIISGTFDPPPDNESANEVAKVVKEMVNEARKGSFPQPGGPLPGGGPLDPFPGFF